MSVPAIRVDHLGKQYLIRHELERPRYKTLREALVNRTRALFPASRRHRTGGRSAEREFFWAVKDLSFEVQRGEAVGIVGRNGAGKSTLLKLLSRITEPTTGRIDLEGRVASLLEVGTGFHAELTGRENIYLNGAILGMSRAEITRQFDGIVDFSGVERFLDTPVKRYSSGMYMRLAFAVAAHLEPEILIVDEVLAVGDAEFQKKCLGKMDEVAQGGRTVLFVSHNLAAMRALCRTGILLENGMITKSGLIHEVCDAYAQAASGVSAADSVAHFQRPAGDRVIWLESVTLLRNATPAAAFGFGDEVSLQVRFQASTTVEKPIFGWLIRSAEGGHAVAANNHFLPSPQYSPAVSVGTVICHLGAIPLMAGRYSFSFWLCRDPHDQHHVEDALHFQVEERDCWGTGQMPPRGVSLLWWPCKFEFLT